MKITIYELLGMVKEGKAPKRFKYYNSEWVYNYENSAYWNDIGVEFENYMGYGLMNHLNDEVEIIEEPQEHKIPEKLDNRYYDKVNKCYSGFKELKQEELVDKINEILDYLSKEE